MPLEQLWLIITASAFNVTVVAFVRRMSTRIDLKETLREKAASAATVTDTAGDAVGPTSFSRVAGLLGAAVIAAFVYALANAIIFKVFTAPADIAPMLSGVAPFMLSSAALFAPYAVNQLTAKVAPS